jgi:PilZ domain
VSERNIRRHRRIPYAGPVRISWQDTNGQTRYIRGECIDVSEGGLRIETAEPIPIHTLVVMAADRLKLTGSATIKHVDRRDSKKFVLGLELSAAALEKTLALAAAHAAAQVAEPDKPVTA